MISKMHIATAYGITRQRVYQLLKEYPGLTVDNFSDPDLIFNLLLWGKKTKLRSRIFSPAFREIIKNKLSNQNL